MEREHTADLIAALEQHLRELFLTRAKLGTYTPPHINTEIERIQGELTRLQSSAQSFDGMTMGRVLMAECMRLDTAIRDVRREVRDLREHIDQRFDSLLTALAARVSPEPKPINRRVANGGK